MTAAVKAFPAAANRRFLPTREDIPWRPARPRLIAAMASPNILIGHGERIACISHIPCAELLISAASRFTSPLFAGFLRLR
jgi:hypothetical protein